MHPHQSGIEIRLVCFLKTLGSTPELPKEEITEMQFYNVTEEKNYIECMENNHTKCI